MSGRASLLIGLLVVGSHTTCADEAVRRDGSRVAGQLKLADSGRFAFRSSARDEPLAEIEIVRFQTKPPTAPAVLIWHQICLNGGEKLLAELLRLDAAHLHVRTVWAEELTIPRAAIDRVTNAPGGRPVFVESFDSLSADWVITGEPKAVGRALAFNKAGQTASLSLKESLSSGRVVVGIAAARTTTRRLVMELSFDRAKESTVVRVELVGPAESFVVASPMKATHAGRILRDGKGHKLAVEFDRDRLNVFVNDLVLWSQETSPGELRAVKFLAEGEGNESVAIDDVLIAKPSRPHEPRPWADLTVDAIRSPDGDETYGDLVGLGPIGLSLETKGKKLAPRWPDVAVFAFRRTAIAEQATTGEHVQIRVRAGDGVRDVLEGAMKSFGDKSLVLSHAVLGDLTMPRDRLEEIRLLFHGRRIPVDSTPRHLGTRAEFGFAMPKPEGLQLTKSVKVTPAWTSGFVVVDAARVSPEGTPLELLVNGESLGNLNRLADRDSALVKCYRLPLPASRAGDVEIELRLRPNAEGRRTTGIDLRGVRLELHDSR